MIPNGKPFVEQKDILAIEEVLRSGWLTTGPKVAAFEQAFASYVGSKYAVAVNSGTAALELALQCLEISSGEVITTPLTFVATSNAILYGNLTPVFVDVCRETLNIDPPKIRAAITDKTKAIICVDYAGQPCDLDEIKAIAREHNLFFIEDAAHAIGAEYKGKQIGSIADLTTFSFHPVKNLTTGEGGMITTDNEELYRKLLILRNHGLDKDDKKFGGDWSYNLTHLGRNYRLTDFQCALGISQLEKLERANKRREEIVSLYRKGLSSQPQITSLAQKTDRKHANHLFIILVKGVDRNALYNELKKRGIQANVHYIPIYRFDYYQKFELDPANFPATEDAFMRMLTLPLYVEMSDADVEKVIAEVKDSIQLLLEGPL